jgi:divalent metal cation (Fe/Co/Zn/Cd) transporter
LHVEVNPGLTLVEAHDLARRLGDEIREQNPKVRRVNSHIEVAEPEPTERPEVTAEHRAIAEEIRRAAEGAGEGARCHEVRLYRSEGGSLDAVLHCDFLGSTNMGEVHFKTERIEGALRERFPLLEHVVVHAEPREEHYKP